MFVFSVRIALPEAFYIIVTQSSRFVDEYADNRYGEDKYKDFQNACFAFCIISSLLLPFDLASPLRIVRAALAALLRPNCLGDGFAGDCCSPNMCTYSSVRAGKTAYAVRVQLPTRAPQYGTIQRARMFAGTLGGDVEDVAVGNGWLICAVIVFEDIPQLALVTVCG